MNATQIKQLIDDNIEYLDWQFHIGDNNGVLYLQIRFLAEDNYNAGTFEVQHCRKWQLSEYMTTTEIVQTAWAAVQRAVLHEAAEQFKYKGVDIYNTHMRVDKLVEMRNEDNALEHRAPQLV